MVILLVLLLGAAIINFAVIGKSPIAGPSDTTLAFDNGNTVAVSTVSTVAP